MKKILKKYWIVGLFLLIIVGTLYFNDISKQTTITGEWKMIPKYGSGNAIYWVGTDSNFLFITITPNACSISSYPVIIQNVAQTADFSLNITNSNRLYFCNYHSVPKLENGQLQWIHPVGTNPMEMGHIDLPENAYFVKGSTTFGKTFKSSERVFDSHGNFVYVSTYTFDLSAKITEYSPAIMPTTVPPTTAPPTSTPTSTPTPTGTPTTTPPPIPDCGTGNYNMSCTCTTGMTKECTTGGTPYCYCITPSTTPTTIPPPPPTVSNPPISTESPITQTFTGYRKGLLGLRDMAEDMLAEQPFLIIIIIGLILFILYIFKVRKKGGK